MNRPKINVIEQTSTIHHEAVYDGETLLTEAYDEPVYEAVTREMNDEEYAEYESSQHTPEAIEMEIESLKAELSQLDYIGVKIATGRATREEYADEIARMNELANRINELEVSG